MSLKQTYQFRDLSWDEKLRIAELVGADTLDLVNKKNDNYVFHETIYSKYIKRLFDIIISLIGLIITFPINCVLLIGTVLDVGRPVFYSQTRIGKNKKLFRLVKFRNMKNAYDENGILLPPEERVTKWGKIVRKNSLDELLNFWYILKGDMSLIGPRPMPAEYMHRFSTQHNIRHLVKPGLECPLHNTDYANGMTWENRFDNDVWYVKNISLRNDLMMCWLLVKEVLFSSRRNERSNAEVGTFIGYNTNGEAIDSYHIPRKYYDMIYIERDDNRNG